jgi:hypothetical protein
MNMGETEYRLLWNKVKPAIATPIFAFLLFFALDKPLLTIFEFTGALLGGCISVAIFYLIIRANIEAAGPDYSRAGNPVTVADRYADSYLSAVVILYVFYLFAREAYLGKILFFLALAAVPMYLGEAIIVARLERKIKNRIVNTRLKGENIVFVFYFITIFGFVVSIVLRQPM